jgi:hypothetical protein
VSVAVGRFPACGQETAPSVPVTGAASLPAP